MTDKSDEEYICQIHGCEMDWVVIDGDPYWGEGFWVCEMCVEDEEAHYMRPSEGGEK